MNHQQPGYQRLLLALSLALALLLFALAMPDLSAWAAQQQGGAPFVGQVEPTFTPTRTPIPTSTNTPIPPTSTPTNTPTSTPIPTATDTPIPTATDTPVPTATTAPGATETPSPTTTPGAGTATTTQTPGQASTPGLTATPTATPSPLAGPLPSTGGGSVLGTLFQLPLPGCLTLLGCLLVLGLLAFLLRRRQQQISAQGQPSASVALPANTGLTQPAFSPELIPQPAAPSFASAPEAAPASDPDALFALAAARLAPEPASGNGLLETAPAGVALAVLPPEILLPETTDADQSEETTPSVPHEQPTSEEQPLPEATPSAAPGFAYRLGELLIQDATGMLYYAEASQSQQPKAIKLLSPRFFSRPRARKLFLQQAQGLTLLEDPHLVPVEEIGIKGSRGYLVMPYLSGGSLADRLTEPLTLQSTWRYLKPLAKALDYLHECQVVHLHLIPENILFDEADQLRLSGAGLVTLLLRLAQENGASFLVPPSAFVAPEQQAGEPDWRSDLYTLGVLLYAMLTGQDEVFAQGNQPPEISLLHTLRPDLPLVLEDVLAQALAENPEARYQSAEALALAFYAAVRPGS